MTMAGRLIKAPVAMDVEASPPPANGALAISAVGQKLTLKYIEQR